MFVASLDKKEVEILSNILYDRRKTDTLSTLKALGYSLSAMEKTLVNQKDTIEAIKMCRERLGITLTEAKYLCDEYRDSYRSIKSKEIA